MLFNDLFESGVNDAIAWFANQASLDRIKRSDIRKYPGTWIHFSKMNKLGINPRKTHKDPPGIYFYSTDWLLNGAKMPNGDKFSFYGLDFPHYFIVNINNSKALNLNLMSWSTAKDIAARNNWLDNLIYVAQHREELLESFDQPMALQLLRTPGGLFYATMDYLVNRKKNRKWLSLLGGIDVMFDLGQGIIHRAEPYQALVLNPKVIKPVTYGTQVNIKSEQKDHK